MTKPKGAAAGVLEIEAGTLKAALADVAGVVEARNTIPILSNVLLSVTPTALTIMGTDMDAWVSRHVTIEAGRAFEVTVEASTLRRIVDKLPSASRCVLSIDGGQIALAAGRSRFKLPTLPSDDFPQPTNRAWDAEFEMPAVTLLGAIDRVVHAISTEETRYYLNGVFLHSMEAELRVAATDGHRLARMILPVPDGAETIPDVIIPRKVIKLIDPLLGRHEGPIDVRVSKSRIRFEIGETVVDAKLIDGQYPDYQRVIPTSNSRRLSIEREALIAGLTRVTTVADGKLRVVKAELNADVMLLTVSSPEKGQGSEEVPCKWSGAPLTIGFNAKLLLDALGQLTAITVDALLEDSMAPTMWRDDDDSPAVFVVMPLRV